MLTAFVVCVFSWWQAPVCLKIPDLRPRYSIRRPVHRRRAALRKRRSIPLPRARTPEAPYAFRWEGQFALPPAYVQLWAYVA